MGGADKLERDRGDRQGSLASRADLMHRVLSAPMLPMHVNLSARHSRNGRPRVHALRLGAVRCVSCSRTPPLLRAHCLA